MGKKKEDNVAQLKVSPTIFGDLTSKAKYILCTGLKYNNVGIFEDNCVYNSAGGVVGYLDGTYQRVFSINCKRIISKPKSNVTFCESCNTVKRYVSNKNHKNFTPKYYREEKEENETPDKLVECIQQCLNEKKILNSSACYNFLLGMFEAIAGSKSPNGFRYNKYVSSVFVVLLQLGKQKLFRFFTGEGWKLSDNTYTFYGILPFPSISTVEKWKSANTVQPGFSSVILQSIINQFEDVCKDEILYVGMAMDEMEINKGLVIDGSGKIVGFPSYGSDDMLVENDYVLFLDEDNIEMILNESGNNENIQNNYAVKIREEDKMYFNYMKKKTPNNKNSAADSISCFFLILHNGKGKGIKKFCCYYPTTKRGHNTDVNGALFLQGFLALSTVIKDKKIRFCTLTLDGDTTHRKLFSAEGLFPIDKATGSFRCPFINQNCYYFQDAEHVMKRVRNNILPSLEPENFLLLNEKVISWQMLVLLVENDQENLFRNVILSKSDVFLTDSTKMKTTHVSRILKPSVLQGLERTFGDDAESLITLLKNMDDFLFVFRHWMPLGIEDSDGRIEKIKNVQSFFRSWREEKQSKLRQDLGIAKQKKTKLHHGIFNDINISITSLLSLFEEAKSNQITIIPRTISQNPLENIFCLIRQFCGCIRNPSIREVVGAITGIVHTKNFKINSKSSSYEVDNQVDWFSSEDKNSFEKRNQVISKLPSNHWNNRLHEVNEIDSNSLHPIINRLCNAVQNKLKFTIKPNSSILQDIVVWIFSVLHPDILQPDLPQMLQSVAHSNFCYKFAVSVDKSEKIKENDKLLPKVLDFLIKVSIGEFLYNRSLGLVRGNRPFRDNVSSRRFLDISLREKVSSFSPKELMKNVSAKKEKKDRVKKNKKPTRKRNSVTKKDESNQEIVFEMYNPYNNNFSESFTPVQESPISRSPKPIHFTFISENSNLDTENINLGKREKSSRPNSEGCAPKKKRKVSMELSIKDEFKQGPWLAMLEAADLPPFYYPANDYSLLQFNVAFIKKNNICNVKAIVLLVANVSQNQLSLKDPTGYINAETSDETLSSCEITEGSVIVLRNIIVDEEKFILFSENNIVRVFPSNTQPQNECSVTEILNMNDKYIYQKNNR